MKFYCQPNFEDGFLSLFLFCIEKSNALTNEKIEYGRLYYYLIPTIWYISRSCHFYMGLENYTKCPIFEWEKKHFFVHKFLEVGHGGPVYRVIGVFFAITSHNHNRMQK